MPAQSSQAPGGGARANDAGWLTRATLAALALLYALAVAGSGFDRIIAEVPSASPAAGGVPAIFSDASLRRSAAIELAAGRFTNASDLARRAVIRSPVEPASTGLLGAAWLAQGKSDQADKAFRVGGQLGWRDPVTQTYWMQVALLIGDFPVAAQRLDAILRRQPGMVEQSALLAPFERDPAGRKALAQRLAGNPGWTSAYFNPEGKIGSEQLAQRAQTAVLLAADHQIDCAAISPFLQKLINGGAVRTAHDLWQLHCPGVQGRLINDPDFKQGFASGVSPFSWQKNLDGSIDIRSSREGGLLIENSASFPRNFAQQMLVLEPGDYRLSWKATEVDGRISERIEALTGCTGTSPSKIAAVPVSGSRLSGIMRISGACDGQMLTLRIRPGPSGVTFGNITAAPLGAAAAR